MADPKILPQQFQAQSNSIASYNYTDIAEGVGYSVYYLIAGDSSAGDNQTILTPSSTSSGTYDHVTEGGFASTTYKDFDIEFKLPKTMSGTAYFSGQVKEEGGGGAGTVTAKLYHYDGATETLIGAEAQSQSHTGTNNFCIIFDVAQTRFKRGDILRLKVKTSAGWIIISVDPSGVSPSITPSKLAVPFKLEEIGY